ncbi:hypothetical protein [Streptomyces flavidovirens]|uniref:hypothetical protein n=1 Tax=Streptomyces flavidovirens TaxID=67298 RepID=UPI0003FA4542
MVEHGHALYDDTLALAASVRARSPASTACTYTGGTTSAGAASQPTWTPSGSSSTSPGSARPATGAADWLREHHQINLHLSDHRRVSAQLGHADDEHTAQTHASALRDIAAHADELRPAPTVEIPDPHQLQLEQVLLPRDAFFRTAGSA